MVSFNLKVLAKFGLCSNCSQKLDGCSLARARKIFATACQMLVLAKIHSRRCSQRPFYTPSSDYMSCEHGQSINQSSREIKLALYVRVPDINVYLPDEDIDSEHRQKYTER